MHGPFTEFAVLLLIVTAHDQIDLLAQVGVAVLLFAVGLKLDLHHIRHIGPVALATGLGQLGFTIVIGFALILALGKGVMEALYVAVALTFSSTIIIVKLLSDKRELDSLHGRIAAGFLIVKDLAMVIAMMAMSALRGTADAAGEPAGLMAVLLSLSWRLAAAAVAMFVLMRWVLPALVAAMARSQELLLVFAIAWGVALAALGEWAVFSKEAGAFLAGFSFSTVLPVTLLPQPDSPTTPTVSPRTWPASTAIRTRPAHSGRCGRRPALTESPLARAPGRRC